MWLAYVPGMLSTDATDFRPIAGPHSDWARHMLKEETDGLVEAGE